MGGVAVAAGGLPAGAAVRHLARHEAGRVRSGESRRELLAGPGYPNGFEVTLGTPNDRYINDEKVAQAAAQMLARIGIKTNVDASTASTFFDRRRTGSSSRSTSPAGARIRARCSTRSWRSSRRWIRRPASATRTGAAIRPELDALIKQAQTRWTRRSARSCSDRPRSRDERFSARAAAFEVTPWAFKKGVTYKPRIDQYTLATEVVPGRSPSMGPPRARTGARGAYGGQGAVHGAPPRGPHRRAAASSVSTDGRRRTPGP